MVFCTIVIVKLISMVGLLYCNKVPHRSLLFKKKAVLMYIYIVLSYYHKLMVSKVSSNPFNFTLSVLSLKRKRCEYFFSKCFFNKHGHPDRDISGVKQSALCLFPLWTQSQPVSSGKSGVMILIPHRHNKGNPTPPAAYMRDMRGMWLSESTSPNSYSFGVWPKLYGLSCDLLKVSCVVYH